MKLLRSVMCLTLAGSAAALVSCSDHSDSAPPASSSTAKGASSAPAKAPADTAAAGSGAATAAPGSGKADARTTAFTPPSESSIPDNEFGAMVRKGQAIFMHTQANAGKYVGNDLNCSNCHLDAGRRANSAPLWGAWGMYPAYRSKNDQVNTYAERLQGCFQYSMNGTAPPADSEVITALSAYSYWMAKGAPTGVKLTGAGFPKQGYKPPKPPSYERGEQVFQKSCALCHGDDGQGQKTAGVTVFPPLWGAESFNWGAGMHKLNNAAAFIKANMPYSRGGTLSDQDAWDVAKYMDSHERPQDPRFTGNVAATRKKFHDSKWSLYGTEVNGHLLGSGSPKAGK